LRRALLVLAFISAPLAAQDSTRVAADSVARDSVRRDTVRTPIAAAEVPRGPLVEGTRTTWDRPALFASGAITLAELVAMTPGVTSYTSGFIASPTATAWYGRPGAVRVFLDGVEIDALDQRHGGSIDLATIPLWSMGQVTLERGAGELRVHLRSWRVQYTPPSTRTDILTGSDQTNLYRGFYGKRFSKGGVLQIAGQQYTSISPLTGGDGDALSAFLRAGTVRGNISVDAVMHRFGRKRTPTRRDILGTPDNSAIGSFAGRDVTAYLRVARGQPADDGLWWQAIAATVQHVEEDSLASGATTPDPDTTTTQGQFVGAVGVTRGGFRLSGTARYRTMGGNARLSPSLRAERVWSKLGAYAAWEGSGPDSTSRIDLGLSLRPLSWIGLNGAVSSRAAYEPAAPAVNDVRAELDLRLKGHSLTFGAIALGDAVAVGMPVYDTAFTAAPTQRSIASQIRIAGPLRGPFSYEWTAIKWSNDALYRAPTESHAEIRVSTALREYLPRGTFNITAAFTHDWRGTVEMPDGAGGVKTALGAGSFGTLLDIRIGAAHIFWYNRNLTGKVYETVPGYIMPRLVQLYGLRWEFWN
jgi:hypothetical protein